MEIEASTRFQYRDRTDEEHIKIQAHDSKLDFNNVPVPKDLNELVKILHEVFSHDFVNFEYVIALMENYKSNVKDWRQYAKYDPHKYKINILLSFE